MDVQHLHHIRERKCCKEKQTSGLEGLKLCKRWQRRRWLFCLQTELCGGLWCSEVTSLHFSMPKTCPASRMEDTLLGRQKSERESTTYSQTCCRFIISVKKKKIVFLDRQASSDRLFSFAAISCIKNFSMKQLLNSNY